jgi:chemotaxis methyl-accepting protein methylase
MIVATYAAMRAFGNDWQRGTVASLSPRDALTRGSPSRLTIDNVRYYLQHGIAQPMLSEILAVLRVRTNEEMEALLGNLLISITNFFRDPAVWSALRAIIPRLFVGKNRPFVVSTSGQHAGGIT